MTAAAAIRFFRAVSPVPPLMSATCAATAFAASIGVVLDPGRGTMAVTPILVLQVFASASGFAVPARRGHYDLLLTRGIPRWHIALAHCAMSTLPGMSAWIAVGVVQLVASGGSATDVFAEGTCAAMLVASLLPWALTAGLPRFAGAIGWLLVAVVVATLVPGTAWRGLVDPDAAAGSPIHTAAVFLLNPTTMLGKDLTARTVAEILPAVAVAIGAAALACWWIHVMDVPLESAQ